MRRWTPAILIQRICALADAGVPLAAKYIKKRHYYLYRAAVKRFPSSWAKAIRAAGFDPNEHKTQRGRWNRAKAEAWVKKHAKDGRSVLAQRAPKDLVSYVHQHVKGGWDAFIESLGFTYPGVKRRRDWTAPKLLAEMRKWKRAGCSTNYRAVSAISQALIHQARKFFGSWKHARAAAGV